MLASATIWRIFYILKEISVVKVAYCLTCSKETSFPMPLCMRASPITRSRSATSSRARKAFYLVCLVRLDGTLSLRCHTELHAGPL